MEVALLSHVNNHVTRERHLVRLKVAKMWNNANVQHPSGIGLGGLQYVRTAGKTL